MSVIPSYFSNVPLPLVEEYYKSANKMYVKKKTKMAQSSEVISSFKIVMFRGLPGKRMQFVFGGKNGLAGLLRYFTDDEMKNNGICGGESFIRTTATLARESNSVLISSTQPFSSTINIEFLDDEETSRFILEFTAFQGIVITVETGTPLVSSLDPGHSVNSMPYVPSSPSDYHNSSRLSTPNPNSSLSSSETSESLPPSEDN